MIASETRLDRVYKNPENSSNIEFIQANNPSKFQSPCVIDTETSFHRSKPRSTNHRDYKPFKNKLFWEELFYELLEASLEENTTGFKESIKITSSYPKQTEVCTGLQFAIYEQNPFKSNNR